MNKQIVKGQLSESLQHLATPLFICGGAYSGKSELAHACLEPGQPAAIIGTSGTIPDAKLEARIDELKAQRPTQWETFEHITDLLSLLKDLCRQYPQVVLDSVNQHIATALVNRLEQYDREQIEDQIDLEITQLATLFASITTVRLIIVSADASAGIPPQRAPARAFRKILSKTNCLLADAATSVIDVRYGIPIRLK